MPLKKKRISELEEANDMRGFYTIGYRIVNGVNTSLKFCLEKVQTAYENMVAIKDDATTAIQDIRSLETTVETKESAREKAESGRVAAEQARVVEYGGVIDELNNAKTASESQTVLAKKATEEATKATQSSINQTGLAKIATDNANVAATNANTAKDGATTAAAGANAAKIASENQTTLAKAATDKANVAANAADEKAKLAGEKAALADAAAQGANQASANIEAKIQAAVDGLIAGAPGALDTLQELAKALGNDPNFATTMTTELGKKLNKTDIVNDLSSGGTGKALSAEQGKSLKSSLDSHNHDTVYEKIINKLTAFNKNFGTTAGTVCEGNDLRLSNARTPLAHTHTASDVTSDADHRFVSDAEKENWSSKADGNHNHDSVYSPKIHKHAATDVTEDSTHKFMTQTEKNTLSSLGTKAILLEAQNLGQNGYQKYSNGLLIQWGTTTGASSGSLKYLSLNLSFYDTDYNVQFTGLSDNTNEKIVYAPMIVTKSKGQITLLTRFIYEGGGVNTTAWRFNWFAIGRWK